MTQEAALYNFFNSFGVPAYPNTAIPKDPVLPYITYPAASGYFGDDTSATVQLWMRTESEAEINAVARRIGDDIGFGGKILHCDTGALWITRGTPWVIAASAQDENTLKLRQMNVSIQHLTR